MGSILTTIKKMLGITEDYKHFDSDIIVYINSALMTLNQLGVGPKKPASITSELETWSGIFENLSDIESVKTFIYIKVRVIFDPPSSSYVLEALNRQADELAFRLNVQVENYKEE